MIVWLSQQTANESSERQNNERQIIIRFELKSSFKKIIKDWLINLFPIVEIDEDENIFRCNDSDEKLIIVGFGTKIDA